MWTAFDQSRFDGRIEDFIEILKKHKESNDSIINELLSEFYLSKDEAEEYLNKYNNSVL